MSADTENKIKIIYTRFKPSCYISHLDMIDIVCKALRRLKLPYLTTQGCHSRPKISFSAPLPLGHASNCEEFTLSLKEPVDTDRLAVELSEQLPDGMQVTDIITPENEPAGANGDYVEYLFGFSDPETARIAEAWLSDPNTVFENLSKGKTRAYHLLESVQKLDRFEKDGITFIEGHFIQGRPNVPSVSKIVTALAHFLGNRKEYLKIIERIRLKKL